MRIEPKAFVAIETSMSAAMKAEWDRLASSIVEQLHSAIAAKKWAEAQELANKLTLQGVVTKVRPRLEELAVSALLFGAHRVTGDVKETQFAKGTPIPVELQHALGQLEHAVEHDAAEYVRKAVHDKIEELKRLDATAHMQKHDVYTEPDKRPDSQMAEEYPPEPDEDGETARREELMYGQAESQQKGDVSDAQLAETGGLLEPEQGQSGVKRKKKRQSLTKTEGPKTLYVKRPLLNAMQIIAWAKAQGFKSVQKPEDMHVTVCYSKTPFDWDDLAPREDNVTVVGGNRVDQAVRRRGRADLRQRGPAGRSRGVLRRRRELRFRRATGRTSPSPGKARRSRSTRSRRSTATCSSARRSSRRSTTTGRLTTRRSSSARRTRPRAWSTSSTTPCATAARWRPTSGRR